MLEALMPPIATVATLFGESPKAESLSRISLVPAVPMILFVSVFLRYR